VAEGILQLPVDGTGKQLRTVTNPAVAGGAHQEVVSLAGPDGTLLDPATQATLAAVLARLLATLSVGGTVTVANPTAAGLTDGQLRAAAVPVSGFPASQAVSAAALPLPSGAATDATAANLLAGFLARYKAVTTAKATYNTSGNHTLITPPAGQSLRVVWLYAQAKADLDEDIQSRFDFELHKHEPCSVHGLEAWPARLVL